MSTQRPSLRQELRQETSPVVKQEWVCEVCGLSAAVWHAENAGVMDVVYLIENQHDRLAKLYAPHCRFDVHKVRVRNAELADEYAWNRQVNEIQSARKKS